MNFCIDREFFFFFKLRKLYFSAKRKIDLSLAQVAFGTICAGQLFPMLRKIFDRLASENNYTANCIKLGAIKIIFNIKIYNSIRESDKHSKIAHADRLRRKSIEEEEERSGLSGAKHRERIINYICIYERWFILPRLLASYGFFPIND